MRKNISGFTLIELMIATMIASIGILTVSWTLISTQSSWKKGNEKLDLQRDAYRAMIKIEHELRPASLTDISISGSTVIIDNNGKKFFLDGSNDLSFQESSGASVELVVEGDEYTDFVPAITSGVVIINFTLVRKSSESPISTSIKTSVKPRN